VIGWWALVVGLPAVVLIARAALLRAWPWRHAAYVYRDCLGRVVYVGETDEPERRHKEHRSKAWFAKAKHREVIWFWSEKSASRWQSAMEAAHPGSTTSIPSERKRRRKAKR